ncbi:guanylate kinase [Penicillium canariense]|uniref:Guanylate kinase n=1 Tax=Penicillium canariense TaxID=189055 RepID=A0A9W9IMI5_9EURO|nr:guanylate kinase [Penicillium canariense]KAJ5176996.1 guanylate kinase [Penicillium canariense]
MALTAAPNSRVINISGPSGNGKRTLAHKAIDKRPDTFTLAVSHTSTRSPRAGERQLYGTSKASIVGAAMNGLVVMLNIEPNGGQQIQAEPSVDACYIFIKPPSLDALGARLRSCGTESDADVQRRLARACVGLEIAGKWGSYDKPIVNDDLEMAYRELEEFAL